MNVPFTLEKSGLEIEFIKEAAKENMVQLKQHKSVGGMRASIYNAKPLIGVEKSVTFMKDFQARYAWFILKIEAPFSFFFFGVLVTRLLLKVGGWC